MDALVAKRYVKALKESFRTAELVKLDAVFSILTDIFKQSASLNFMQNPEIDRQDKENILLDAVKSVKSNKLNNFIRLLVEKNRIDIIPAISNVLTKEISAIKNNYIGYIYSNEKLDEKSLTGLSKNLSDKIGAKIDLQQIQNGFDGIKVNVKDLGIEIDFSKTKIDSQITNHILKAI